MAEKLNIAEILKDAPKGTKLWSSVCGDCTLLCVTDSDASLYMGYPITCEAVDSFGNKDTVEFTEEGLCATRYPNGECVLFPSKENRDWATFKVPKEHKHFEPFQKVLRVDYDLGDLIWTPDFYGYCFEGTNHHILVSGAVILEDDDIIPYEGNEDKLGKSSKQQEKDND